MGKSLLSRVTRDTPLTEIQLIPGQRTRLTDPQLVTAAISAQAGSV